MDKEKLYGCGLSVESLLDYWRNALPEAVDYAELSGTPPLDIWTQICLWRSRWVFYRGNDWVARRVVS